MQSQRTRKIALILLAAALLFSGPAYGAQEVRFANVSWTGVTVKTELGKSILDSLGYEATIKTLSVPIAYKALDLGDVDVFLGNWMPSMASIANEFFEKGTIVQYVANMPGAKYTLAAPSYVVDGGLKDFSDIAKFADKLEYKIYGIEPGNDGNLIIQSMIDENKFGLGDFKLIATSEPIMLSEVKAFSKEEKWVVFLGWSPHYMNQIIDMKYLTGSTAETFGENDGTATVYTNIHKGFDEKMPNVGHFLKNFIFPISTINEISLMLQNDKQLGHGEAGLIYLKKHPEIYRAWLEGVTTADGIKPALPVFEAYLEQI
ncbi:ABC transporter substrate-binding protein [Desulfofustis glycolicus]|uniref:Glycine betaine/proline transport system substrate-binding protein n=1 Tax=Desulfofustis glycolicus DSM 9705 TaxID=1121409 RepID=A0A1M5SM32_9BACT|nr:ABC transporter substrate-binding protein [Desulfofustis glycolicus]SHH39565.1 glycine betaine/proline transport system substrate-binding protein [Desulfofustis glycolicus DSM 9705]